MAFRDDHEATRARADALQRELAEKERELAEKDRELAEKDRALAQKHSTISHNKKKTEKPSTRQARREDKGKPKSSQKNDAPIVIGILLGIFLCVFQLFWGWQSFVVEPQCRSLCKDAGEDFFRVAKRGDNFSGPRSNGRGRNVLSGCYCTSDLELAQSSEGQELRNLLTTRGQKHWMFTIRVWLLRIIASFAFAFLLSFLLARVLRRLET